jgi:hypothetical protein
MKKYVKLNQASELERIEMLEVSEGNSVVVSNMTDEQRASNGIYELTEVPMPAFDPRSHWLREIPAKFINSIATQQWQVLALPPEQAQANFDYAKSHKRELINTWRAEANQTYFMHAGKQIECDALSRSDIDAVAGNIALTGDFPAGFPNAWKTLDNSYIALPTVQSFKDMYSSMTLQGTANFGHAQELKAALAASTTLAALDAVRWS